MSQAPDDEGRDRQPGKSDGEHGDASDRPGLTPSGKPPSDRPSGGTPGGMGPRVPERPRGDGGTGSGAGPGGSGKEPDTGDLPLDPGNPPTDPLSGLLAAMLGGAG